MLSYLHRALHVLRVAVSAPLQLFLTTKLPYNGRTLEGKLCVISGGTSGIGLATAEEMVKRGCDVILLVRDTKKCANVVSQLSHLNDLFFGARKSSVRAIECELTSLASVRMCVSKLKELVKGRQIDYFCCTAAVFLKDDAIINSTHNHELHYSVNHLGHFALLEGLLELLRASQSRIVMLTSDLMVLQDDCSTLGTPKSPRLTIYSPAELGPLQLWRSLKDFASSRLASFAIFEELHARYPELSCVAVHPPYTGDVAYTGALGTIFALLKELVLVSHNHACQSVLHCLLRPDVVPRGTFYHSCFGALPKNILTLPPCLLSVVFRKNIWDQTSRECLLGVEAGAMLR